jgi:hypothetical protein
MKKILCLSALLLVFGCSAGAAPLTTPADTRALADAFMKLVAAGKVDDAFELVRPQWPIPQNEINTVKDKTGQQRKMVETRFGDILGSAFIREEKVSDFIVRYTYVEKRDVHLIRWLITFYRPLDTWKVNAIKWDDDISALFNR